MALKPDEVLEQSKNAFRQWESKWREYAKINGEKYRKDGNSHKDLVAIGIGKSLLCVASGPSLEDKIEMLRELKTDSVDIMCVDKCLGTLIDNGVKPSYVMLADAGIDYDKWLSPWVEQTKDIILIANVTSNAKWTHKWKGKVIFYVNKDNIKSEEIFSKISGCGEMIPAASNVGNASIVFATQIMGYDEYLLLGYDYCWGSDDNYYSFENNDKRYWMGHIDMIDLAGRIVKTSHNLYFSARWLVDYFRAVVLKNGMKLFNCSGKGILFVPNASLEYKLKNARRREISKEERDRILSSRQRQMGFSVNDASALERFLQTNPVSMVIVNYIKHEDIKFVESL